MKMHFWEQTGHRLSRHQRPARPAADQAPGTGERIHERVQTWLNQLADTLPHFDRPDKDESSKPH